MKSMIDSTIDFDCLSGTFSIFREPEIFSILELISQYDKHRRIFICATLKVESEQIKVCMEEVNVTWIIENTNEKQTVQTWHVNKNQVFF